MLVSDGRESFKQDLGVRFNRMLNGLLSNVELLCKNDFQYNATRKKVLRLVNDALRDVMVDVDKKYEIKVKDECKEEFTVD